ncbi:PAS domain-containing protein [Halorientalis regularis]|jgi:PAS domain S-box-containing protein|uniref:PAS domain S-box-containing protein n=1 Tax=Halorientalis regularis TaxID=660518 RepID=A0A1G7GSD2_9EURY|nr:PAS domain-containing protein [Halorientalis regularis]SDE90933.1 PAS domain S-box-containing protein [Halorientalis regularis]
MSRHWHEATATGPAPDQLPAPDLPASSAPIRVLYADDNAEFASLVEATFGTEEGIHVVTVGSVEAALEQLDGVDCVVSNLDGSTPDGDDLLAAVRDRDETLPFILFTVKSLRDVPATTFDGLWTDYLEKNGLRSLELLGQRVRRLVAHQAATTTAQRGLAAAQAAQEGIAIVDPDGTIEFANTVYATRLGYEPDEIEGRPWQDCYTDAEADRIASSVLPTVADDWRWTGECVARRKDGDTVALQARIVRLEDESLVIVHDGDAEQA